MGKNKYIESPKILSPEIEFDMPGKQTAEGFYQILPNRRHIGGKNALRDLHKNKVKLGYVYLIRIEDTNKYKVGVSTNPKRRLSDISNVIPFQLEILALNEVKNPYHVEEDLMRLFSEKLIRNEWFELSIEDAKYIMITLHNIQVKELTHEHATD